MDDYPNKTFLELCLAKQLLDTHTAAEADHRSRQEQRSVAATLLDMGALPQHTIDELTREIEQALTSKSITGFRIIKKLGQGGMGSVYLAEQLSLHREVALKVIAPQFAADAQTVDRFMREARTAAAVNHPNIISVIDVGYQNGHLYMALELVPGGDAAQLAARFNDVLPEARALEIIIDCCQGLQALYEARLIHRDIKPANIFITREGSAKLGDLGLARSEQGDDRLTVSGHAIGTPAFMSPEQASGKSDIDIRTDIYSLGAALFALTTGSPPFTGEGVFAIAAKLLTEPAPDPRTLNPALSLATAQVIARCLAKQPADRFQTPRDLFIAITGAMAAVNTATATRAGAPVVTSPLHMQANRLHPTPATISPRKVRTTVTKRAPRSVPWPMISGITGLIAVAVVVGMMWNSRTSARPHAIPSLAAPAVAQPAIDSRPRSTTPVPTEQPLVTDPAKMQEAMAPAASPQGISAVISPEITGLIAHWPLDEGHGSQVRDLTGISAPGTIMNATWTTGRIGKALAFSPPSTVVLGNAPRLSPTAEITVMFWLKTPGNANTNELVSVVRHDRHFTALQRLHDGTANAVSWAGDHVNLTVFPWRNVWDDQRWHHYAVTYHQDRGMHIYRDGVFHVSNLDLRGQLPNTDKPFILGGSERENEYFTGVLDDVRVYDRALEPREIESIFAAAK